MSANGPKRKPHIQGDGFCIQVFHFDLFNVGTGKPTKTLCDCARANGVTESINYKLHFFKFLNRKLITDGILRNFCLQSTFEDKLNVCRQTGAGMQFHFINICM